MIGYTELWIPIEFQIAQIRTSNIDYRENKLHYDYGLKLLGPYKSEFEHIQV